jgi:radical SAM superfamily enzyme YgiQ (UPF0313 family)
VRIALIRTYQPQMVDDLAQPLGIMALDAYLRTKGYEDIHLFDMRLKKETPAQILDRVLALQPDLIGLSSLTIEKDAIHQLSGLIKQRAPHVITVIGGPYATSSKSTVMRDPSVDYLVVGEGELTFTELLDTIRSGGELSNVKGILYRDAEGQVRQTEARPTIQELDSLPLPSWDRIDFEAYQQAGSFEALHNERWAVFDTSRGCPFKCTYCHDVFGKKFRARTPKRVIAEMELLYYRYGVRAFHIYDDIFNFNKQRVLDICALIKERGWKIAIQFPNGVRADMMDVEMLTALKEAGTVSVNYAIESASKRIQKSVRKHLRIEKVEKLIEETDRVGLLAHGYFMLGFPGETREEIQSTIDWACNSRLHTAAFFLVCPFEGSPLADGYVAPAKELNGNDWQYYNNPHSLAEVDATELKWLQRQAYIRFYMNPARMARFMSRVPDKLVLLRFAKAFFKIIGSGFKVHGADEESWDHSPESLDEIINARPPTGTSVKGKSDAPIPLRIGNSALHS